MVKRQGDDLVREARWCYRLRLDDRRLTLELARWQRLISVPGFLASRGGSRSLKFVQGAMSLRLLLWGHNPFYPRLGGLAVRIVSCLANRSDETADAVFYPQEGRTESFS